MGYGLSANAGKLQYDSGSMVLFKEDDILPRKWKLGRITDIHSELVGNTRVATVHMKDVSYIVQLLRRSVFYPYTIPARVKRSSELRSMISIIAPVALGHFDRCHGNLYAVNGNDH